jgi:hypothetical protein
MAVTEKQLANLKILKAGETANPNGRPKGTKNRATVLNELLAIKKKGLNTLSDKTETMTVEKLVEVSLIQQALLGNVRAIELISQKIYGKIPIDINMGGQENNPIVIDRKVEQLSYYERLVIVYGKDSDEVKEYINDNPGADKRASED